MTLEKLKRLQAYKTQLKHRLEDATPKKHLHRPKQYREFLLRELENVSKVIDLALLEK